MTDFPALSPETIAQARELYDAATPNADMREFLGMTEKQFLAFRKAQGWPLRDRFAVPPRRTPSWAEEEFEPPPESLSPTQLIQRLEEAVGREFARAERALDNRRPRNAEARLRIMASLVRMLSELKRVRRDGKKDGEHDPQEANPPRDLAELRAELSRRLKRMALEEEAT